MKETQKITTEPEVVIKWAEERGGKPARIKGTGNAEDPGMIRIDFPNFSGEDLEGISWEKWIDVFEQRNLALVYQEETKDGEKNNFNKLIDRDSVKAG